jgi:hypothetical protein
LETTDSNIRDALQKLADEQSSQTGEHLTTDELLAYQADALTSSAEAERIQNHLTFCSGCADDLLALTSFASALQETEPAPVTGETALAWTVFQKQIAAETGFVQTARPTFRQRLIKFFELKSLNFALAAMLVLITVSLGAIVFSLYRENRNLVARLEERQNQPEERKIINQTVEPAAEETPRPSPEPTISAPGKTAPAIPDKTDNSDTELNQSRRIDAEKQKAEAADRRAAQLEQRLKELSEPQVNVPIIEDAFLTTRSDSDPKIVEMPNETRIFTVIIPADTREFSPDAVFELEIRREKAGLVTTARGLRKDPQGTFTISLSKSIFPAGAYYFRLYGLSGGKREIVAEYNLQFRYK